MLAHSLSGAAIQLQGARKLAEREQASPQVRAAIERAGELVRDGLANARQAVGALRGEELPGIAQLDELVASFKSDMNTDVTLHGRREPTPASAGREPHALPRRPGGAHQRRPLRARRDDDRRAPLRPSGHTSLTVEDRLAELPADTAGLVGVGGGNGLNGLRERLERAGGRMQAGPTDSGWRVELEVPA